MSEDDADDDDAAADEETSAEKKKKAQALAEPVGKAQPIMPVKDLKKLVENEKIRNPIPPPTPNPPREMDKALFIVPVVVMLFVIVAVVWFGESAEPYRFVTGAGELALSVLGTLAIVALFVERAQQIYVGAWRGIDRATLDNRVTRWKTWLAQVEHYPSQVNLHLEITEGLQAVELELAKFRQLTRRYVFFIGLAVGVLIAAAGPRLLREILEPWGDPGAFQAWVFAVVDILITGGLIGGGSEGIHKIMVLVTDSLDRTRQMVNRPPETQAGS
jgi:hypothetical protein